MKGSATSVPNSSTVAKRKASSTKLTAVPSAIRSRQSKKPRIKFVLPILKKKSLSWKKKKEVLEEQQNAIDDQIEQVDAYYEELISNTESYWDTQIKGAEDVKSRWEELQDLKEQLELNVQLISMGISPDDISQLTSEELFEKVKEHYLGILADISSGNSQMLSFIRPCRRRCL